MLQFAYTIFYVADVRKSIEFYEQAFGLERKFIAPNGEYGELITGNTTLSFASHEMGKEHLPQGIEMSAPDRKPFGMEIGFVTDDVPAAMLRALNAGAILVAKEAEKPWGQVVGYVRDINGFLVELCTAME